MNMKWTERQEADLKKRMEKRAPKPKPNKKDFKAVLGTLKPPETMQEKVDRLVKVLSRIAGQVAGFLHKEHEFRTPIYSAVNRVDPNHAMGDEMHKQALAKADDYLRLLSRVLDMIKRHDLPDLKLEIPDFIKNRYQTNKQKAAAHQKELDRKQAEADRKAALIERDEIRKANKNVD
jgi:hypothetical protein